jgi:hypothetical protein
MQVAAERLWVVGCAPQPKFLGQLLSEVLNVSVSSFQYACLTKVSFAEPWKPDLRNERSLQISPTQPPKVQHTARSWWRYAVDAVVHHAMATRRQKSGRISWCYFCELLLCRPAYIGAYKAKLRSKDGKSVDSEVCQKHAWQHALVFFLGVARADDPCLFVVPRFSRGPSGDCTWRMSSSSASWPNSRW